MRRGTFGVVVAAAGAFVLNAASLAQSLEDRMAAVLEDAVESGDIPGVSATIITADGEVHAVAAGLARKTPNESKMTTDAKMLSGSIGKTYCAVVLMQLAAEGKLEIDAKASDYLGTTDWFERLPNADDLTIRSLMNHTSGIPEYVWGTDFSRAIFDEPQRTWTFAELIEFVLDRDPQFEVGESWSYADTNYLVLGAIVEKITGRAYEDELRDRVLKPLELDNTLPTEQPQLPGLVSGYSEINHMFPVDKEVAVDGVYSMNPQFERTGGGLCSTSADLARFGHALFTTDLVREDLREMMVNDITDARRRLGPGASYGLGVIVQKTPAGTWWGHEGIMPGFLSGMAHYHEKGFTVAVQVNTDMGPANGRMKSLLVDLARLVE